MWNGCLNEKAAYLFSSVDKQLSCIFFYNILTFINQTIPTLLILLPTLFAVNADQMFFFIQKQERVFGQGQRVLTMSSFTY